MKDIEEQFLRMLKSALDAAERTGEFVMDQAPELLIEFYRWHTARLIFFVILCIVGFTVCLLILRWSIKKINESEYDADEISYIFTSVISGVVAFVSLVGLPINLYELIFIKVAPKLYLIEYLLDK